MLCTDDCLAHASGRGGQYGNNSYCQDGEADAISDTCAYGTDCTDCGPRYLPPPPPSPSPPPPRVRGIQKNIAVDTLTAGLTCITKYSQPYWDNTYSSEVKQYAVGASPYAYALLGARYGASGNFKLAAMGDYDAVFAATSSFYSAYSNSGTYWYFYPGYSMGFAPSSFVSLGSRYDSSYYSDSNRMSWHLDHNGDGGRAGSRSDSTSGLYKVVMYCN